jgi:hypothetical protein
MTITATAIGPDLQGRESAFRPSGMREVIARCDHPLSGGRTCCYVKGHDGRHSHTWQPGDARYLDIDGRLIDMETGEVVGYSGDLGHRIIEQITGERIGRPEPSPEEKQAKARRVLETQYGARFPEKQAPCHAVPPKGYTWHYEGTFHLYGRDHNGNDVAYDFRDGKVRRIYSLRQRREAVEYARKSGASEAARKLGIPRKTIVTWMGRGGE